MLNLKSVGDWLELPDVQGITYEKIQLSVRDMCIIVTGAAY